MSAVLRRTAPAAPEDVRRGWPDDDDADQTLGVALAAAATARPHAEAVVCGADRITFGALFRRSEAVARQLHAGGVGPGDVVTWTLPNGFDSIAVAAAIWRLGAVSNPVVEIYRAHELQHVAAQLRPRAVVASPDVRGKNLCAEIDAGCVAAGHRPAVRLSSGGDHDGWVRLAAEADDGAALPPSTAGPDDVALVLYTSGTTAAPKGVMHSSRTLLREAASMRDVWGLTADDAMVMASPLTHVTGLLQGLLVPCITGARALLMARWDPDEAVALIERERATYMAGATPFLLGVVQASTARGLARSSLRQYCCGGAAVPPALIEEADTLGIKAYRCWGMTELPTATLASADDPLDRRARWDGRRAPGVEVETVDEDRQPLAAGEEGELRIRGPEQMLGYTDAERTAESVDDAGWFYTGDLGTVDDEGWVRVTGRLKDIINRGGEKFSTREIEELLAEHPDVADVAVVPLPHDRLGELACAVIVPAEGHALDTAALDAHLRARRIAVQKLPERYETAGALPRTRTGKVQKHLIIERLLGSDAREAADGSPGASP